MIKRGVLDIGSPVGREVFYAQLMSSDAFVDLGRRLGDFAQALRNLLNSNQLPMPGSISDKEAHGEPYAGEWSAHPSRDIFATIVLTSWSCSDHLAGTAILLEAKRCIPSLYTLARASAEAAVIACYLSEVNIDPLERIRRNMNCNLDGLCQDLNMLGRFNSSDAKARVTEHKTKVSEYKHFADHYGFEFKQQDRYRSAFMGEKPKSVMTLIDECASQTPGLGAISYQMFSGIAHVKVHGLSRFMMHGTPLPGEPGKVSIEMNITAGELAQQLFVAPMCASTLINHLRYYLGWDTEDIDPVVTRMHATWCRIAGVPFLGPNLR